MQFRMKSEYKHACELNIEFQLVKKKLSTMKKFNCLIVFSQDEQADDDDEWNGLTDATKKLLKQYFGNLQEKLSASTRESEQRHYHISERLDN